MDKEHFNRYRGHISLCEIDLPGQEAICNARVLIVGAGGLGSPVALYLAAAGVGTIGIVDPDRVSLSNLQRQIMHTTPDIGRLKVESASESMRAINPDVKVETHAVYLDESNAAALIGQYDITVDCCDNFATRLLVNDTCVALGRKLVYGAVSRFSGHVFTHLPGTADYRTFFDATPPDDEMPCAINGILNAVVGITGSIQAAEVLKLIAGTGDPLTDRLLVFDAVTMDFQCLRLRPGGDEKK